MEILIAEDDPISRRILTALLTKWGYTVKAASDGAQAWSQLEQEVSPRLAILDWMMPGMDGLEICRRVREKEAGGDLYTYVIILTAKGAKEDIIEGMDAGADDYLVKPFDPQELRVRVRAGQRIVELQSQLKAAQEELRRQSITDPLTGVLNRRATLERFHLETSRAKREKRPLSVLMMDVDHFKKVNDNFGHICGDEVLKEVARRVRTGLRDYDTFGRIGGEEFMAILPGATLSLAVTVAERLRAAVSSKPMSTCKGAIGVRMSVGVTQWAEEEEMERTMDRADKALYLAKKRGRNRVEALDLDESPMSLLEQAGV